MFFHIRLSLGTYICRRKVFCKYFCLHYDAVFLFDVFLTKKVFAVFGIIVLIKITLMFLYESKMMLGDGLKV